MRRLDAIPLLDFTRKGLEYHQAGFKINDVCRYYWQTRDAETVRALRPRWEKEAQRLVDNRTGPHGLFPPERYAGDISTPAQTVNANANAWRALRDLSAVLAEIGESAEAERYADIAREFRSTVLAAIEKSARRETTPPFVPVALFSDEPAHDPDPPQPDRQLLEHHHRLHDRQRHFPGRAARRKTGSRTTRSSTAGIFMGMMRSGGDEFNFWTG